jgi:DNA-binding XRE family transcriptional regulator
MTGADVQELRAKLELRPGAFARLLGVDDRTVRRWEAEQSPPTGTALHVLTALRESLRARDAEGAETLARFLRDAAPLGLAGVLVLLLRGA